MVAVVVNITLVAGPGVVVVEAVVGLVVVVVVVVALVVVVVVAVVALVVVVAVVVASVVVAVVVIGVVVVVVVVVDVGVGVKLLGSGKPWFCALKSVVATSANTHLENEAGLTQIRSLFASTSMRSRSTIC